MRNWKIEINCASMREGLFRISGITSLGTTVPTHCTAGVGSNPESSFPELTSFTNCRLLKILRSCLMVWRGVASLEILQSMGLLWADSLQITWVCRLLDGESPGNLLLDSWSLPAWADAGSKAASAVGKMWMLDVLNCPRKMHDECPQLSQKNAWWVSGAGDHRIIQTLRLERELKSQEATPRFCQTPMKVLIPVGKLSNDMSFTDEKIYANWISMKEPKT